MRTRTLVTLPLAAAMIVLGLAISAGQESTWTPPRTPDGQPDIQGVWTNYTATPFEVPDSSDNPALYAGDPDGTGRGTGPSAFLNDTVDRTLTKGRSLVVDPPNGRVPIMPWAEEQRTFKLLHIQDHWLHHTPWERCITRGVPGGIFPTGYGSGYQILQGSGHVAILYEMIHEARIIPVASLRDATSQRWFVGPPSGGPTGRPHVGNSIRLWNGDSRGRWEGNTLVVDITNYNDKGSIATNAATQRVRSIPQSEELHVVERYTRVDEDTLNYEVTIEDPKVFTAPWRVAMPLHREPDYRIFEYACHEGNLAVPNTLSAGRARDRAVAARR